MHPLNTLTDDERHHIIRECRLGNAIRKRLLEPYFITEPKDFHLKEYNPAEKGILGLKKKDGKPLLKKSIEYLSDLQELLYANGHHAILLVFQAIDAGGKDGTIKHVMSGVNPQGVKVSTFKQPSTIERAHDFLWRIGRELPSRGHIGIFNRSHYEEVLVTRVHPEVLDKQNLAVKEYDKSFWESRYEDIRNFEKHLVREGTVILKFFLNISKEEQRKRFLARLDDEDKLWKFSLSDIEERHYWDEYQHAYEEMIHQTSTPHAPWVVVPANHKWFARLIVIEAIIQAMLDMKLTAPIPSEDVLASLHKIRKALQDEKN